MPVIIKCEPQNFAEGNEVFRPSPVWVYENCEPTPGDEAFVWMTKTSTDVGGLAMRGTVEEVSRERLSNNRPIASLTVRIGTVPLQQALTVTDLASYDVRQSSVDIPSGPGVELCRKLYINSHNKVARLSAEEAAFLRAFFSESRRIAHDAVVEIERLRSWAERASRPDQREFSASVRELYGNRCAVTGCWTVSALQAAHIRVQDGIDDNSASNGILLRADIHLLFDALLITLSEDGHRIELSRSLVDSTYGFLRDCTVYVPDGAPRPSQANILHHRERFRRAEAGDDRGSTTPVLHSFP